MTTSSYRLPREVLPRSYAIDLDASLGRKSFGGTVGVEVKVLRDTHVVVMHARHLRIRQAQARVANRRIAARVRIHAAQETIELVFAKPLPKGSATLVLEFSGKLSENMHGLYLAKDGPEKAIVSQCEASDARAIFPCFDEPDFKATFQWTVRTDPGLTVVTNGKLEKRTKTRGKDGKPGREVHCFAPTRIIPTYLVAVTIGAYDASEPQSVRRIPCRVLCGRGKLDQAHFAQEVTAQVLPWYEDYFEHRYNYQKLDQVAVPGFDAGAMENVGAIFYRQSLLLMRPGAASWAAQKRIAEVIAHEIAHQWFGNLVTMKWWDDLWLNEAFATWIANKAIDSWRPDWRMWDDHQEPKENALSADSLVNTHPIYTKVETPAQATELFDLITYEKGCAVLRMAESFLGAEPFRQGLVRYVRTFKNGNAQGADLWNALEEATGQPVASLMHGWITQAGFPLVQVSAEGPATAGVNALRIRQSRFHLDPAAAKGDADERWHIPMVIRYGRRGVPGAVGEHRTLMTQSEQVVELPEAAEWVFANADSSGFYRTELDALLLERLLEGGRPRLSPAECKSLLEDEWALVRCGHRPIDRFMDVLSAFRGDMDYLVARALLGRVTYLEQRVVADEDRGRLNAFVRWLFAEAFETVGWDPRPEEGPERAVLRAAVLEGLGDVGRDPRVLREALAHLEQEVEQPTAVEPNLADVVVGLSALSGDEERFDRFVAIYLRRKKTGAPPQLQARYLHALASFEVPEVVELALRRSLDGTIPQEQLRVVLINMLMRRASQRATWEFLKKNWHTVAARCGAMGIARLVEASGGLPLDLQRDVETFFAKNPVEEAHRALRKALEAMELRRAMLEREGARLSTWLRDHEATFAPPGEGDRVS